MIPICERAWGGCFNMDIAYNNLLFFWVLGQGARARGGQHVYSQLLLTGDPVFWNCGATPPHSAYAGNARGLQPKPLVPPCSIASSHMAAIS